MDGNFRSLWSEVQLNLAEAWLVREGGSSDNEKNGSKDGEEPRHGVVEV